MSLRELLKPFYQSDLYWYFPRAFFPYPDRPEGLPGFHQFMQLVAKQAESLSWSIQDEERILDELRNKGAMRLDLDAAEDYHVHYRNRVNFGKKLGLLEATDGRRLRLTQIGRAFVEAPLARQSEIMEHQLIRWQFANPAFPSQYKEFQIFPYLFTLSVLLEVPGNFLTMEEFVLRVSLARNHNEKDSVIKWVEEFRHLSDSERESAKTQIDLLRNYAGRVIMLLFSCAPSLSFTGNTLVLSDPERATLVLGKCWPRLTWQEYTEDQWEQYYGMFLATIWPLIRPKIERRRRAFKRYVRREGSSEHKDLKRYLIDNAEAVFGRGASLIGEEYYFPTSDRANLAFVFPNGQWLTVEVEVDIPEGDIVGVLQAIKYKYMCVIQENLSFDRVRTALVAHTISQGVKDICQRYGVEIYEV